MCRKASGEIKIGEDSEDDVTKTDIVIPALIFVFSLIVVVLANLVAPSWQAGGLTAVSGGIIGAIGIMFLICAAGAAVNAIENAWIYYDNNDTEPY